MKYEFMLHDIDIITNELPLLYYYSSSTSKAQFFFAYLILCNDLPGQMLKQTLLSRTLELFVVFVVDLSIPRIRGALYAIVLMALHVLLFGSLQF